MKYEISGNDIVLYQPDLILGETLDCGQAFRWELIDENTYSGFYLDTPLVISGSDGKFILKDTTEEAFLDIWKNYFDLDTDYNDYKNKYSQDSTLKSACEYSKGIRLLRQDSWEALVSYIFSQHNNIPRIKGIISRLVLHYGGFPTAKTLASETPESLGFLRSGFRAKYVIDAAQKVASGEVDLEKCKTLPIDEARHELMKIKGVGPKVADCVMLYGMYRLEAFPIDVWIKRAMESYYPDGLPECTLGSEGIAQLYIFNYIRNLGE